MFHELTGSPAARFPAKNKIPEFTVFASLLRMVTKYDLFDVLDQLLKNLKGAYPTRWKDFEAATILGEGIFGSPKPHPNAVLNLFEEQGVRFAIPFAAYRVSLGGFPAIMGDKPGRVLPRHTLASTIYGMEKIRSLMTQAAHAIAYEENLLSVCSDTACVLNVSVKHVERRMEALMKLHDALIGEREGGVLSTPSLKYLACATCTKAVQASHAKWRSRCWEKLRGCFWSRGAGSTYNSSFMATIPSVVVL